MQDKTEAARERLSRSKKSLRLVFNPKKLAVDDQTIVVQRTNDGGYICLGLGSAGQFLRAVGESNAIEKASQPESSGSDPFLSRLKSAIAFAKDYDPNQPRDDHGRWSDGGSAPGATGPSGAGAGPAVVAASMASADAFSLYGNDAIVPALEEIGARALAAAAPMLLEGAIAGAVVVGGAAAVLGTLFLPMNRNSASDGTLPDAPEFAYHYDNDTGRLTVTRQNDDGTAEEVFSGHHDTDGIFRDENGNAIGRFLGGSVALDADAISGYEARRKSDTATQARANTQTAVATRSDAKLCPNPGPDKSGYKSPGAIAYQMYVGMEVNGTPLAPGLGIKMVRPNGRAVYLDDCRRSTGALIEAKGFGYSKAMNSGKAYPWFRMYDEMMDQSARQLEAARGRPVEWHFAEKDVADYMRKEFAKKRPGVTVFYTPPPRRLIGQLKRIAEGAWDELRYLAGSF